MKSQQNKIELAARPAYVQVCDMGNNIEEGALEFFNRIPEKDKHALDPESYRILLQALARIGLTKPFEEVWRSMTAQHQPDDGPMIAALICLGKTHGRDKENILCPDIRQEVTSWASERGATWARDLMFKGNFSLNERELFIQGVKVIDQGFDPKKAVTPGPSNRSFGVTLLADLEARDTSKLRTMLPKSVLDERGVTLEQLFDRQLRNEVETNITIKTVSSERAAFENDHIVRIGEKVCEAWRRTLTNSVDQLFLRMDQKGQNRSGH